MRPLINDNVLDLPPYRPTAQAVDFEQKSWIRLSANENPFPLPPGVLEAILQAGRSVSRYPDSSSLLLRRALAARHRVNEEQIIVGAGSTELISMIVSTFLKPGERVLTSEGTFLMYRLATIAHFGLGALLETQLGEDLSIDLMSMTKRLSEKVKVIFIANPNNPTGRYLSVAEISAFAAALPKNTVLVLDNAYQEYVGAETDDGLGLLGQHENLIVLRTFSKVYGLASLRVGYAVASHRLIDYLNRVKPPFNVSGMAQAAALTALSQSDFVGESIRHNTLERERLEGAFAQVGLPFVPSQANFILFTPPGDAGKLCQRFKREGILLRPGSPFGLPGSVRVTIGQSSENDRFLELLKKCV